MGRVGRPLSGGSDEIEALNHARVRVRRSNEENSEGRGEAKDEGDRDFP